MSHVSRGAYYKNRTRKWLAAGGWQVADMEVVRQVGPPDRRFAVKRDQFGADLLAMSGSKILFVQVKGGATAARGNFPEARRAFAAFRFPSFARRIVIAWLPGARQPRIVDMSEELSDGKTKTETREGERHTPRPADARRETIGAARPAAAAAHSRRPASSARFVVRVDRRHARRDEQARQRRR
jgi:hypothetical protein